MIPRPVDPSTSFPSDPGRLQSQGEELYKDREVRDGRVWIWRRQNLYSSALEQVADPRRARGVRHPFQAILRLTLLGLVCGQTTMAHIGLFARMHWPMLKEPLGFVRDHPPHATAISRTLAGVSPEQLQGALSGWVAQVVAEQELSASVDGKWAKQSEDANGNPLVMVNVLAHDLKLCLAQWLALEKRYEPGVLREQLGQLFEGYPRAAAADHGRPLCGAGPVPGHCRPRTGLPGANQGEPAGGAGRHWPTGLPGRNWGSLGRRPWGKSGCDRETACLDR